MNKEYPAHEHPIAREHYRRLFSELLPEFLDLQSTVHRITSTDVPSRTSVRNIVVLGAGYGGLTAVLRISRLFRKNPGYQIHLIDRNPFHTLKTQLHEAAVRHAQVTIPIERIIRKQNIVFHMGNITAIDLDGRSVQLKAETIPFDYLVIAIGSKTHYYDIPGLEQYSLSLQSLDDAQTIYNSIKQQCARAALEPDSERRRELLRFVIGGGGLTGVEFAGELADFVERCSHESHLDRTEFEIIVVEAGSRIAPTLSESLSEKVAEKLGAKHVEIRTDTKIVNCSADTVSFSTGETLKVGCLIWTGGIRISDLIGKSGIKTGPQGRVIVDQFLRVDGYPYVYAIGDSALAINPFTGDPVPAAAQFALQQGRLVAENIHADAVHAAGRSYRPRMLGEVISLGRHLAVGWLALPLIQKITFVGFLGSLVKTATREKHIFLLKRESRNWMAY